MIIILIFFQTPSHSRLAEFKWKELPFLFDVGGVILLLAALVCLLLALEVGGVTRAWNNHLTIGLLLGFGLITIAFAALEWKQGERSMVVFRILRRRTIATMCVFAFCVQSSAFARSYNLPIYFQAAQGVSPSTSGIRTLASVLTVCELALFFSFPTIIDSTHHWYPSTKFIDLSHSYLQFRGILYRW